MGSSFPSAGTGVQGTSFTGLSASDTLSVSCESSSKEPVPSWSTTTTPSSGLTCTLLTLRPIVPNLGVPLHTPNLDGIPYPCDLGPGVALGPGSRSWSTVPSPGLQARQEGDCLQGWWKWTVLTNRETPASPQPRGEQTGIPTGD